jgi:hypothetical protein
MKDVPPEVAGQIALSVPLFAFGLALFLTAFLLVAGALLSLIPNVYTPRFDDPNQKRRTIGVMVGIALLCAVAGWLTLQGLSGQLTDAATIMSNVQETKE